MTRGLVTPGYVSTVFPGVPFVTVRAGPYFAAERDLGTPAATPAELATAPEAARMDADTELVEIHQVRLGPAAAAGGLAAPGGPGSRPRWSRSPEERSLPAAAASASSRRRRRQERASCASRFRCRASS